MADLRKEVRDAFDAARQDLGFKATFEDVEGIFFLCDFVESEGYVSARFRRALPRRLSNVFWNWNTYLHNLVVPNPNSMVMVAENQMFSDEDRAGIIDTMNAVMAHVTRSSLTGVRPDKAEEAAFIDDSVTLWRDVLQPKLTVIFERIGAQWAKKASEPHKVDGGPRHP